jgi:hypothetical protein
MKTHLHRQYFYKTACANYAFPLAVFAFPRAVFLRIRMYRTFIINFFSCSIDLV